jgi:single-stranded-DNA-specific exonuclease
MFPPSGDVTLAIARELAVPLPLAQVLVNRGVTLSGARAFLQPETVPIPAAVAEFPGLAACIDRLAAALNGGEAIAICGDYDVDGMTSTALLLRTFWQLGGRASYEIPSRMTEGYGINERIVSDLHARGVGVIVTVDNGIAAIAPIALAVSLGMTVVVTDHHDVPAELPPTPYILNPKLLPPTSPYGAIAGVGVAYVLGLGLAERFGMADALAQPLLDLFTLGTIADLASLTGINRVLVQRGLQGLSRSPIVGIQALMAVACPDAIATDKPETVGFRLGPRINAIGRIGDPQTVIELLTTADRAIADHLAQTCEQVNRHRQALCQRIESEAIAYVDGVGLDVVTARVLILVDREVQAWLNPDREGESWHHGVIGIVAARLVERYGAPVFLGSLEQGDRLRFSVRGIPEFHVFESLEILKDLRTSGGGHRAAGGFTLPLCHLEETRSRLKRFALEQQVAAEHICPLVTVDAQLPLAEISPLLWQHLERLQPCGMGNAEPVFWAENVTVRSQQQRKQSLSLELVDDQGTQWRAVAWRWAHFLPLPSPLDVAYKLRMNEWQQRRTLELELVGVRLTRAWQPTLTLPRAPQSGRSAQWYDLQQAARPLPRPLLLYGQDRPAEKFPGDVDCDRPRRHYHGLVLWTLPPSLEHLRWLLAIAQPQAIYLGRHVPAIPAIVPLTEHLIRDCYMEASLPLLELSQKYWVSPRVILACLRSLGLPCADYPPTGTPGAEWAAMEAWYRSAAAELAPQLSFHD